MHLVMKALLDNSYQVQPGATNLHGKFYTYSWTLRCDAARAARRKRCYDERIQHSGAPECLVRDRPTAVAEQPR